MENNGFITDEEKLALKVMESFHNPDDKASAALDDDGCMAACRDIADMEAALRHYAHPMDAEAELRRFHKSRRRAIVRRMTIALAVAAVFIGALFIIVPRGNDTNNRQPIASILGNIGNKIAANGNKSGNGNETANAARRIVSTPRAKTMKLTLPDGTTVWLNAGSRLTYPASFDGDTRTVELHGEAFFSVTHDAHHPFIVKSGNISTKVLGTKFDIRNYDGRPVVTLVEGRVQLTDSLSRKTITMQPGQSATVTHDGSFDVSEDKEPEQSLAWKDGYLYFDDTTFGEMLTETARWYGMEVECHNEEVLSTHIHFTMPLGRSAADAAHMMSRLGVAEVSVYENKFVVK